MNSSDSVKHGADVRYHSGRLIIRATLVEPEVDPGLDPYGLPVYVLRGKSRNAVSVVYNAKDGVQGQFRFYSRTRERFEDGVDEVRHIRTDDLKCRAGTQYTSREVANHGRG